MWLSHLRFFYWNWGSYTFLSFSFKTFKSLFISFCRLFNYKIVLVLWPILEDYRNFFWCLVSKITDAMSSPSTSACTMAMITVSLIILADIMKSHKFTIIAIFAVIWYGNITIVYGIITIINISKLVYRCGNIYDKFINLFNLLILQW